MKIYSELREKVLQHLLDSGCGYEEPVREVDLAEHFEVSMTPVREVLNDLEQSGFVVRIKRKGTFLKSFSVKEISELYDLRSVLEGLAARLLVEVVTDEIIDQLQELADKYVMEEPNRIRKVLAKIDYRFHSLLVDSCKNDRLVKIVKDSHLIVKILKTSSGNKYLAKSALKNPFSHSNIVEAIGSGDADTAENVTRKHVEWAKDRVVKVMIAEGSEKLKLCK